MVAAATTVSTRCAASMVPMQTPANFGTGEGVCMHHLCAPQRCCFVCVCVCVGVVQPGVSTCIGCAVWTCRECACSCCCTAVLCPRRCLTPMPCGAVLSCPVAHRAVPCCAQAWCVLTWTTSWRWPRGRASSSARARGGSTRGVSCRPALGWLLCCRAWMRRASRTLSHTSRCHQVRRAFKPTETCGRSYHRRSAGCSCRSSFALVPEQHMLCSCARAAGVGVGACPRKRLPHGYSVSLPGCYPPLLVQMPSGGLRGARAAAGLMSCSRPRQHSCGPACSGEQRALVAQAAATTRMAQH